MNTETLIAPDAWTGYLIDGDVDGLSCAEIERIEAYLEHVGLPVIVLDVARDADNSPADPWFTWGFDYYGGDCAGGTVREFIIAAPAPAASYKREEL